MNQLFLWYTLLCILSISVIYFAYYMTFIKKKLTYINWIFIGIGMILFIQFYSLVQKGIEVNDKLSTEFQVPKDFYSEYRVDSINNPISDKLLYQQLILMRFPHSKIMLAQAKLESENFTSDLFKRQRNFIGMKVSQSRVTTSGRGKGDFKLYKDWQECVTDYMFWQFSHNTDKLSDSEYLEYIGKIYAEDPNYISKIKKILLQTDYEKLEN